MEYRNLGSAGIKVSALSFGSWVTFGEQMQVENAQKSMEHAYDAGVNFFDNAEAYAGGESEKIMGEVIKRTGWARKDIVVSTKVFWGGKGPNDSGLSRKHVIEGTRAALDRLQLEYVDLVFCHRPDYATPISETVRAMSWLVDQGYAFYWGTSEWSAEQIRHAYEYALNHGLVPPSMEQPQYHMFHRERVEVEYAPLYEDFGLGTTIWSPLASGILTGKYDEGIPDGSRLALDKYEFLRNMLNSEKGQHMVAKTRELEAVATDLACTRAQLALAWCLKNENVSTVITGASRPEQVDENMFALEVAEKLTPAVMERIEGIIESKPEHPRRFR